MPGVFTFIGEQWACECTAQTTPDDGRYVGWGTSATAPAKADTNLTTPSAEARTAGVVTVVGALGAAVWQVVALITSLSTQTIQEVACFRAAAGANAIIHATFGGIAVDNTDTITFTITLDPG